MKQNLEIKKLGEVCDFQGGSQPPKSNFIFEPREGYVRFLQIRDFANEKNKTYIPESKKNRYCVEDDILLGRYGASVGKVLEKKAGAYNVAVMKTIPDKEILGKRYLFYYLVSDEFQIRLSKVASRSAQDGFSKDDIFDFPILIPPLSEQQRIVAILDEAFAAIAKAKANAEQNLKNARELFESYIQAIFENKGEDWEEKRFDEVCVLQRGFDLPTHLRKEGEYPLVSSNGITDRIDVWKVKAPGVATGRSGTIGNVHFIEEDYWPLNTSLYIKQFHGNSEKCIYYFLKQFDLSKYSTGAGVPTLNRNNVHSERVWFPRSTKEQKIMVQKLDVVLAETKKLETIYQKKLKDLKELKKSILQKAFNGESTTTKSVAV